MFSIDVSMEHLSVGDYRVGLQLKQSVMQRVTSQQCNLHVTVATM